MSRQIVSVADGFWNIRGRFKIAGLLDVGTQCSLARLSTGRYVLLDACAFDDEIARKVAELTEGGKLLDAILHLHPFHTVHVKDAAERFPEAKLYGTSRHHARFPELSWEPEQTQTPEFAALFAEDFDFMVPDGVDFVPANENLHFSSVLAFHRASRTLHVDDTLNWIPVPLLKGIAFHPTLAKTLERRRGAAQAFREWAKGLVERCRDVDVICTAHARLAGDDGKPGGRISDAVQRALEKVEKTLKAHERKYG